MTNEKGRRDYKMNRSIFNPSDVPFLHEIGKRIGMLRTVTVEVCNKKIKDLRSAAVAMGEQ